MVLIHPKSVTFLKCMFITDITDFKGKVFGQNTNVFNLIWINFPEEKQ